MELGKRGLVASGLDPERLDKLAAERSKGRKKLAEDARRRAVEASAAAAGRLKGLVAILPAEPMDLTVDQVTFIRSFAGQGAVLDSNIEPSNNWARYRMEGHDDVWAGTGRLSFFTLWRNQLTVPASVTVRANLTINAHLFHAMPIGAGSPPGSACPRRRGRRSAFARPCGAWIRV